MRSYTGSRNFFGDLTQNSNSTNLTLGDKFINASIKQILNLRRWDFLEKTATDSTVASQQFYDLPFDYGRLIDVTVTIGSTQYTPREVTNRRFWDRINTSSSVTSDIPEWYYIFNKQLGFYPTPSSATADAISYAYHRQRKDLSLADYTTSTILTATDGSTAIVGNSSTAWTAKMAGLWLRITDSLTANTGDGRWYEIASITDATNLVLDKAYGGISIAAGTAAYTIGQVSLIPEDYQDLPVYKAAEIYFTSIKPEANQAQLYKILFEEGLDSMTKEHGSKTTDMVTDMGVLEDRHIINPNLTIEL
jgi:hypothetical protein